jgi:hypothetical protein
MGTHRAREVVVVPVSEQSFESAAKDGTYARPCFRALADVDYIAFYRIKPISAITHVCKVVGTSRKGSIMVYTLDSPETLARPIPKGKKSGLLNCQYTTMEKLHSAQSIRELG